MFVWTDKRRDTAARKSLSMPGVLFHKLVVGGSRGVSKDITILP